VLNYAASSARDTAGKEKLAFPKPSCATATAVSRSLFFVRLNVYFILNNCLIETKCPNKTTGTINVGNQLNGKFKIAILGWLNANF
jgi:hypothetical protein